MMYQKLILLRLAVAIFAVLLSGCATGPKIRPEQQIGDSVVLVGDAPAALAYLPIRGQPLSVRNTYLPQQGSVRYAEGRDFIIDYAAGTLRRTPDSRLPDFRKNVLFGQEDFDHSKFSGFGNGGYFAFVDYWFASSAPWPVQAPQTQLLKSTQAKLNAGQAVKIVAFGDSITAGGEASRPEFIFWKRWAEGLRREYPRASNRKSVV